MANTKSTGVKSKGKKTSSTGTVKKTTGAKRDTTAKKRGVSSEKKVKSTKVVETTPTEQHGTSSEVVETTPTKVVETTPTNEHGINSEVVETTPTDIPAIAEINGVTYSGIIKVCVPGGPIEFLRQGKPTICFCYRPHLLDGEEAIDVDSKIISKLRSSMINKG